MLFRWFCNHGTPTSRSDVILTMRMVEKSAFLTSDQRYFNVDPQQWCDIEMFTGSDTTNLNNLYRGSNNIKYFYRLYSQSNKYLLQLPTQRFSLTQETALIQNRKFVVFLYFLFYFNIIATTSCIIVILKV